MLEQTGLYIGRYQQLPLVGRNTEQERLRRFLQETENTLVPFATNSQNTSLPWTLPSRKSFVLLLGEVGIGKTRLAEETARAALHYGWSVVWSRAYSQESHVPYRLWSLILRNIVQRDLWPQKMEETDIHLYRFLITLLPELTDLIHTHTLDPSQATEQDAGHVREALLALLISIAAQQAEPLLIVLDDLQWADESSCELLGYLVRRLVNAPILLIGTVRENELPPTHPLWALIANMKREHVVEQIQVEALSDEQIAALVAHVPPTLTRLIQNQVAGNPFFAEELARAYSAWTENDTSQQKQTGLILPRTIADVLDQRLHFLSPECQRFLQRAAVLGGSLTFDSLFLMEQTGNNPPAEDSLFNLIEEALRAKVLTEEQSGTNISYHFWHPLLMSHLYEKLSAVRRTRLHQHVATVFRQLYATHEEEGAAIIVHHLLQGHSTSQEIVRYAELAGDHSYALAAYPAAADYYRLALAQQAYLQQAGLSNRETQLYQASLLERLGECVRFQGHFQEAGRCFEEALALHHKAYPELAFLSGNAKLEEAQMQAMLCCGIGVSWYDQDDCARARQYYTAVEHLLYEVGIVDGPVWAYLFLQYSYINWHEGMHAEAQKAAQRALMTFEMTLQQSRLTGTEQLVVKTRLRRTLAGDPVDLGRTYLALGLPAGATGKLTQTISYLTTSLQIFEQHDCLREIAIVCCNLGDVYLRRAEYSSAEQYLLRALDITARIGDTALECFVTGNLGLLALRTGKLSESESWYRRGLKSAWQINEAYSNCLLSTFLAFVLLKQEKSSTEIASCLRRAFTLQRTINIPDCTAIIWIVLAYVRLSQLTGSNTPDVYTDLPDSLDSAKMPQQRLVSVHSAVQHALATSGTDIEIRTEAELLQAYTTLFLASQAEALQQATHVLEAARTYELKWMVARAEGFVKALQIMNA